MSWAPLPWQHAAWEQFEASARQQRWPHAWLVSGSAGSGRRHFVQGMIERLLGATAQAMHPDLMLLTPEEDKTLIAVEALRETMERLMLSSHGGGRRVLWIDPADALNESGVNALLKTLEEPPAGVHMILMTQRLGALKATLRSRCQILRPGQPTREQGLAWLARQHPQLPEATRDAFALAPLQAESAQVSESWDPQAWGQLLGGVAAALKCVESLNDKQNKQQLHLCLRWLIGEATQALRARLMGQTPVSAGFARLDAGALAGWALDAVQTLRLLTSGAGANHRLLMESLMIGLYSKTSSKA